MIDLSLQKKWSFPVRISWVNVTKSEGNCWFGHIYWKKTLNGKLHFLCSVFPQRSSIVGAWQGPRYMSLYCFNYCIISQVLFIPSSSIASAPKYASVHSAYFAMTEKKLWWLFAKFLRNTFLTEHLSATASE